MTKVEIQKEIDSLCDQQIKNLERLTTNPDIPMEEIFEKDSEISSEISKLRRELARATLFEHRKSAKKFADETTSIIMDVANNYVLK